MNITKSDDLMLGKIPPQACDVEQAVLGAVMIEEAAIHDIIALIKTEEVFYTIKHQCVWKAIKNLYHSHSKIDLLTVTEQLKKNGELDAVGGPFYVAQLTNKVGSAANVEYHARIIVERYLAREIINIGLRMVSDAYNDTNDVFDLVSRTTTAIESINLYLSGQSTKNWAESVAKEAEAIQHAKETGEAMTGIPTYSDVLDNHLLGLQPGNFIIIAGRPGMGKTTVAWHIARNQLKKGIPVGFFSLEMKDRELVRKMFSAELRVDSKMLRRGDLTPTQWDVLKNKLPELMNYPLQIEDRAGITMVQIKAKIKYWIRKCGIKAVYIDLIGKVGVYDAGKKFGTREQEISYISGELKILASELNIPIVALAQLSRKVEERPDKRPELSDLRDSGALEQDADVVIFPYRPGYYNIQCDEEGVQYPENIVLLDLPKYREGQADCTIKWIFEPQYSSFHDYNDGMPF